MISVHRLVTLDQFIKNKIGYRDPVSARDPVKIRVPHCVTNCVFFAKKTQLQYSRFLRGPIIFLYENFRIVQDEYEKLKSEVIFYKFPFIYMENSGILTWSGEAAKRIEYILTNLTAYSSKESNEPNRDIWIK